MPSPRVQAVGPSPASEPQVYYVASEKLLEGNPRQTVWIEFESPERDFCVGIWASEVGEWRVSYTEQEYCHILEGTSILTDLQGQSQRFTAGMEFVVPAGFVGTWRVVEPTKKRFVIYEKAAAESVARAE